MKKTSSMNIKTLILLTLMGVFAFSASAKNSESEKISSKKISGSSYEPKGPSKHAIGVGVGQTFLMGDFASQGDDSITVDLMYTYNASHSFDLLLDGHVSKHKLGEESVQLFGLAASIKAKVFDFDSFAPYFLGGLGFYQPQVTRNSLTGPVRSDSKMTFGFNFGGGADLKLNDDYTVGMMGVFHKPFNVRQDEQTDVRGMYFKLLLALSYHF